VEFELQSQTFEQVRLAVRTFARAGPVEWRMIGGKPDSEVELLLSLPFVQEQLASFEGDLAADANAAADAIEAALRRAIDLLPSPYQEAAREHFGFGERELDGAVPDQNEREKRAARKLGRTSHRWYKDPHKEHAGLAPRDYVVALIACVLCGIPNPTAYVGGLVPPRPTPHESPPGTSEPPVAIPPQPARKQSAHMPSRRFVALALGGLLACAAAVAAALGAFTGVGTPGPQAARHSGQSRGLQTAPEPVLNPDAFCTALGADAQEHTGTTEFVSSPGQLGGGEVGLVGKTVPTGKYRNLLEVKKGDTVELSIDLHDTDYSPVFDVVVAVAVAYQRPRCARLTGVARSVSAPRDRAELGPLTIKSTSDSPPHLKYVRGSTVLLAESGQRIAHLSDGVMGAGTAIPYQIPPGRINYFVNFLVKVE
jgi:hypothetical protein